MTKNQYQEQGIKHVDEDSMTDKYHEALSALMDDEADELELRRILKAMDSTQSGEDAADAPDAEALKAKWHRYHVVSASLKQEIHSVPSRNLLARIQSELEDEAVPAAPVLQSRTSRGIFRALGQGAIAASVAVAVLFTADLVMDSGSGQAPVATEVAGTSTGTSQLPGLTGDLNPSTQTRFAVQNGLDEEEMSRLQQVVSEELEDSLETREIPATFVPEETP